MTKSKSESIAMVKQTETRSPFHSVIVIMYSFDVIHIIIRKPPPRKETDAAKEKKSITERVELQLKSTDLTFFL